MQKYLVSKAPYLRNADQGHSTKKIMIDLLISLIPVILFALIKNVVLVFINNSYSSIYQALYPLLTLIIGPLVSVVTEAICLLIIKKGAIKSFKDLIEEVNVGFGLIPGLLIVLVAPAYLPLWILILGIIFGEVVGKMLFGGFGQNIFNPALVGYAFIVFTFSSQVSASYMNSYEIGIDAYAGATPLTAFQSITDVTYNNVVLPYGSLWNFFLGTIPGAYGETSALAILIAYIYLSVRKVIDYKVPLIYVGVVFLITSLIAAIGNIGFWYPVYNILSGGLLFGAVFMATEPVTSPKTDLGRIMYAGLLGVLTILFRLIGNLPEGVATAILTMNFGGLIINKYCIKMRVDGKLTKNEVPGLVVYLSLFVLIFVYDIIFTLI